MYLQFARDKYLQKYVRILEMMGHYMKYYPLGMVN